MFLPRARIIIVGLITIGAAVVVRYRLSGPAALTYDTVVAQRTDIVQKVVVTGAVEPTRHTSLAFEQGGKISRVLVTVGDRVRSGQILARLDQAEILANLQQTKAGVVSAQAQLAQEHAALETQREKLAELKRGSRPEERRIKEAELRQAEQNLTNAYDEISNILRDAYIRGDEAIRVKTLALFSGTATDGYQLTYTACDLQTEHEVVFRRRQVEESLRRWQLELTALTASSPEAPRGASLDQAEAYLTELKHFLERTSDTLNTECARQDTSLDVHRTNVAATRTSIAAALSAVSQQRQVVATQQATVQRSQRELELIAAGTPAEQIAAQAAVVRQVEAQVNARAAQVAQAQALVAVNQAQVEKKLLRAPHDGLITAVEARQGEIVSANTVLLTLISDQAFEIKANVPEADIAKLATGQTATVTLDAYGDEVTFLATIAAINPAETVIEDVPTYEVTLQFSETDGRIRSGLTADAEIITARRDRAIAVPLRAVQQRDGQRFVRTLEQSNNNPPAIREVAIRTGLRGSDGNVEIVSGLRGGERVVISEFEK